MTSTLFAAEEDTIDSGFGFSTSQMPVEDDTSVRLMESGVEIDLSLSDYFLDCSSKLLKASDSFSEDLDDEATCIKGLPYPTTVSPVQLDEISENGKLSSITYESETRAVTDFQRYEHPSLNEGNCHLSPPPRQYVKPDEVDFYDGRFDSSPSSGDSSTTHIDISGTENNVGITYHCDDEQTDDLVHTLETVPCCVNSESRCEDSAEVFRHGTFVTDSLYSIPMSRDDSETPVLTASDHGKEVNDHEMVELNNQVCEDITNSKMDGCLKEIMHEELSDDDLIVHGLSSGSDSVDDSESELLLMNDEMELNMLQMDESKQLASVKHSEDHEILEIDEQLMMDNKCKTTLTGGHLESQDSYNDNLDDERVEVNSPTVANVCGHKDIENAKHETHVVDVPVESDFLNAPNIEGVLVNNDRAIDGVDKMNDASIKEFVDVAFVISQLEEHLLEDTHLKTSSEDSSELVVAFETLPTESFLQIANLNAQQEAKDSFNTNVGNELVDKTEKSAGVNLVQKSESYIEEKVELEDQNTRDPSIVGVDEMNNASTEEFVEVPLAIPQLEEHLLKDREVKTSGEDSSELVDILGTLQVESSLQIANFNLQKEMEDSININLGINLVDNAELNSASVNLVQKSESYIQAHVQDRSTSDISITDVDKTNNASAEELVEVPSVIPQSEEHLLENTHLTTSGEDSSELAVVLETLPVESFLQFATLNAQQEVENSFNTSLRIELVDKTDLNSTSVNLVQKSQPYIEERVEDRNTSFMASADVDETNNASTEEFVEVPLLIPQTEEHLLEDAQVKTSGEDSIELVVVFETPPVESFLKIANLNPQIEVEESFGTNQGVVLVDDSAGVNLVKKSESYIERQVEDRNTSDITSTGVDEANNASTKGFVEVPLVIQQSEEHRLEDAQLITSVEDSSELVVLGTPPNESSLHIANLNAQKDVEDSFNTKNQDIVLVDETELNTASISLVQKSESYVEGQVEGRTTCFTMDCYKTIPLEKPELHQENYSSELNISPPFRSGQGDSSQKIHSGVLSSDSEHCDPSSPVDVSRLQVCGEEVEHQTDCNGSFKPGQGHDFGSNSNAEVLKILEKTESNEGKDMPDHIASFFLSDNLFTPCTYRFQKANGGTEFDPSLTTQELLCLSFSEVRKDAVFRKYVPCPVADLNKITAGDGTGNLDATPGVTEADDNVHMACEGSEGYKQHSLKRIYFITGNHQNDCSRAPENDIGSSPAIEFLASNHEVGGDISSSSSTMGGTQGEAFKDPNSSTGRQVQLGVDAISSRFISEEAASPESFMSEEGCHIPTEPSHSESSDIYQVKSELSDNFHSPHSSLSIDEAVDVVKEYQNLISAESDEIPEPKEMCSVSVEEEFPFHKPELQDQAYAESNESSLLLSFHVPENSTPSKHDNTQEEVDQAIMCRSIGHDFHFRGARKLIDQFEECVAKESEDARTDDPGYERTEEDNLYAGTMIGSRTSFHECCGVWDWLRGFRG